MLRQITLLLKNMDYYIQTSVSGTEYSLMGYGSMVPERNPNELRLFPLLPIV